MKMFFEKLRIFSWGTAFGILFANSYSNIPQEKYGYIIMALFAIPVILEVVMAKD